MSGLRIGFFSTVHPHPWNTTKGIFNKGMLTSLVESGAEVSAVVPVPWTETRAEPSPIDFEYPAHFPRWWYVPRIAPLRLASQMALSTRSCRGKVPRPDVVLSYWTDPDGTVAADWAAEIGVPFVQMVGGSDVLILARNKARRRRLRQTLGRADRVITIGAALHQTLAEWGLDPKILSVFSRGVDRHRFFPSSRDQARLRLGLPADRPILAWAGRLVDVKGLDVLVSALSNPALLQLRPLVVLVGDGPLRTSLEASVRATLPPDTVRFVGRVPQDDLPDWYRAANLMVLPSLSEGVPNVLLEAMACGTGFVASAVGGIPDLATEPGLELVPPEDPKALATSLLRRLQSQTELVRPVADRLETARELLRLLDGVVGTTER